MIESEEFSSDFQKALRELVEQYPKDEAVHGLTFIVEAMGNAGADGYLPDWLQPFSAICAGLLGVASVDVFRRLTPIILKAAQLGYTEGYFAGKDD